MSIGLRKAWADLRAGWREWLLAVAALALGLWGVASIVIANAILRTDLRGNFAQTRPAHAVLVSDDFGQVNLSAVRALAGVESAEWRDFALLRVEVQPDDWIPLWLFGVRDFDDMRIRRLEPLQAWLSAQGVTLRSTVVPPFEEHPHQWQLNTLLLLQGAMGLLAFLMGAILVAQLMSALLAKQVRQIAILKALGATYGQLLTLYSAMLAVLGAVAGSVALPLAWISGVAFSFFVGAKLNFDIHPYSLPSITFLLLALVSLLMPVLVSLPVLSSALNAPVREGLGEHGLVVRPSHRRWWLPQFLGTTLAMALRNAARQRRRAVVTVMAMAVGVAIFDSGFNVREALSNMLADASSSMTHDVQVVLNQPVPRARALSPFSTLSGVRAIETWNGGRGELQSRIVAADGGVGIVALPRDTGLFHPRIVAGRWLRTNEVTELVINQQAAELLGRPSVGTELTIHVRGQPLRGRLVGIIEELEKPKVYLDRDDYDSAANPEHLVNSVMFVAEDKDSTSVMALKRKVESAVAKSDLDALYVMSQAERVQILVDHLDIVLTVLVGLSFVVLAVSAFGMASATGIKMRERTRELGVLRAIGATPAVIMRLVTLEGMVVSGVSILLGLVLAQPLSREAAVSFGRLMLGEEASLRYAFSASGLLVVIAVTFAFSLLASLIPARGALRVAPRDALMFA